MISMLKKLFRQPTDQPTALDAVRHIKRQLERLNIPVVNDDFDTGYDYAIEEMFDVISEYEKSLSKPVLRLLEI